VLFNYTHPLDMYTQFRSHIIAFLSTRQANELYWNPYKIAFLSTRWMSLIEIHIITLIPNSIQALQRGPFREAAPYWEALQKMRNNSRLQKQRNLCHSTMSAWEQVAMVLIRVFRLKSKVVPKSIGRIQNFWWNLCSAGLAMDLWHFSGH